MGGEVIAVARAVFPPPCFMCGILSPQTNAETQVPDIWNIQPCPMIVLPHLTRSQHRHYSISVFSHFNGVGAATTVEGEGENMVKLMKQ